MPRRSLLYPLPHALNHDEWARVQEERATNDGGRERILQSRSTPGYLMYLVDHTGLARVADWTYLPDLLMLNPIAYFLHHPHINAIWCDTTDTTDQTNSSAGSDPTGVHTIGFVDDDRSQRDGLASIAGASAASNDEVNYALVVRRRELTPLVAQLFHDMQRDFFVRNDLPIPPTREFVDTLHGR